jgi:hypothetical protein
MTIQSINASLAASFANPSTNQGTDMNQSTQVVARPPVFQSSISGFSVYYDRKSHKFGKDKAAAQAFMTQCKAPVAKTAPVAVKVEADGSPTPREMLEILDAENKDLREQLAMAKALNAKTLASHKTLCDELLKEREQHTALIVDHQNTDYCELGYDLRAALSAMGARKGSRVYKDGVVAVNGIACQLTKGQ